jgi:uncharacterized protein
VADYAEVMDPQWEQKTAALATELEQKTGDALVAATIPSLEGQTIEQAAVQIYQDWGIGQKGESRGLLFLVAVKERRLRIEVGYGLEGLITDAKAGMIRDQAMLPYLEKNRFGEGLYYGVAAAATVIAKQRGVELTGAPQIQLRERSRGFSLGGLVFVLVGLFILSRFLRNRGGRGGRGSVGGSLLAGMLLGSMMGGGHRGGGGGFGSFGGGFGGFGGGMSGGGGVSGGF